MQIARRFTLQSEDCEEIAGAEEAIEAYKLLHEEFPENLEACGRIGQICFENEEYEKAREFLVCPRD